MSTSYNRHSSRSRLFVSSTLTISGSSKIWVNTSGGSNVSFSWVKYEEVKGFVLVGIVELFKLKCSGFPAVAGASDVSRSRSWGNVVSFGVDAVCSDIITRFGLIC